MKSVRQFHNLKFEATVNDTLRRKANEKARKETQKKKNTIEKHRKAKKKQKAENTEKNRRREKAHGRNKTCPDALQLRSKMSRV